MNASSRAPRGWSLIAVFVTIAVLGARVAGAQAGVGPDSSSRWKLYGENLARVEAGAFGWAAWDQIWNDPDEWGRGWRGYERRAVSELAGSFVQETVTEGLAAVMDRPLSYRRCTCKGNGPRFVWAVRGAVSDQMLDGSLPIAVPRIVGGYVGGYARTTWHPAGSHGRLTATLISGTATIGIAALINLAYEFVIR